MTNILIILGFFLLFILTYLGRGYWGWVLSSREEVEPVSVRSSHRFLRDV